MEFPWQKFFPGSILNVKHGYHRAENGQGKFYDMNHHIGHEIEQQTDAAGFQESRSFLRVIINELLIHVDCMCLAESIN